MRKLVLLWTVVWLGIGLTGQTAEGKKYPQPKTAELSRAEKLVDEVFGKDMAKAKSAQEKSKLAQEILKSAREEQDMAVRFAALQAARRLAVEALDGKLGLEIVREIVQTYKPLEEMTKEDRLSEADRLWAQGEKAQGREKLAKQLEAIEEWLYAEIKTGLVVKKWEERIRALIANSDEIVLHWQKAALRGRRLQYDHRQDSISGWCLPQDYMEWSIDLAAKEYEVVLFYSSRGNAGGYLVGVSLLASGNTNKPITTLSTELASTGGWDRYAEKSFGTIKVPRPGTYIIRLHAIRRLREDFEPCLVNVRAVFLR